jgi:hypothetical protein
LAIGEFWESRAFALARHQAHCPRFGYESSGPSVRRRRRQNPAGDPKTKNQMGQNYRRQKDKKQEKMVEPIDY